MEGIVWSEAIMSCGFSPKRAYTSHIVVGWEDVSSDRIRVVLESVADGRAR